MTDECQIPPGLLWWRLRVIPMTSSELSNRPPEEWELFRVVFPKEKSEGC